MILFCHQNTFRQFPVNKEHPRKDSKFLAIALALFLEIAPM